MARFIPIAMLFTALLFGYSAVADNDFARWKVEFRQVASQQGIRKDILDTAFIGLLPNRKVLRLDAHQPEFTRTIWDYLNNAVSEERIATGLQRLASYKDVLDVIVSQYGVRREYLLAIWGMESNFGQHTGNYAVIRSLATLAYAGREVRREFWAKQLIAALRILQQGDMAMIDLRGSWAGAIGHTQFIPTTFADYAVDFDGDGKRDLKNSIPDALASTANYLVKSGWQPGQSWGEEISLPDDFDWNLADPGVLKPAGQWTAQHQVLQKNGDLLSGDRRTKAYILLPAGFRGPAFMVYPNFKVIRKYNNAVSYALAVGQLADRLQGKPAMVTSWPVSDAALSHAEKSELQELLSAVGYSTEGVDGKIGPNTQSALRQWQSAVGFPPDGYATAEHLELLRGQSELQSDVAK
ncbi:MAG: lytic murein transglycosylase [Thiolinea sp.]